MDREAWREAWGDPLDPTKPGPDEIAEAFSHELAEGYRIEPERYQATLDEYTTN